MHRIATFAASTLLATTWVGGPVPVPTHVAAAETTPLAGPSTPAGPDLVATADGGRLPGDGPDRVAEVVGGTAARVRRADGDPTPGRMFLLMATPGSTATVRVYDETPYRPGVTQLPAETRRSNLDALVVASALATELLHGEVRTGSAEPAVLTSAPGGGPSGGLVYALAHLELLLGASLGDGLSIAATGELQDAGYVHPIHGIEEKLPAAAVAGVDVLFTSTVPSADAVEHHAARLVGEGLRSRNPWAPAPLEPAWDRYRDWGASAPADGMDVVAVRHVGDVVAYLCGTGSAVACAVSDAFTAIDLAELRLSPR